MAEDEDEDERKIAAAAGLRRSLEAVSLPSHPSWQPERLPSRYKSHEGPNWCYTESTTNQMPGQAIYCMANTAIAGQAT